MPTDNTLVAYDYKLSTGSSKEDIKSGRSLQLPIYLEALERLILPDHQIAGGGYYVIRGGNERRNKGLHRATALRYSGISNRVVGVMSDDEWQQIRRDVIAKIWDFLDHMRAGQFGVNPSEKQKTCRFCDFAAVCRYDRYRIDGKKRSADYADSAVIYYQWTQFEYLCASSTISVSSVVNCSSPSPQRHREHRGSTAECKLGFLRNVFANRKTRTTT